MIYTDKYVEAANEWCEVSQNLEVCEEHLIDAKEDLISSIYEQFTIIDDNGNEWEIDKYITEIDFDFDMGVIKIYIRTKIPFHVLSKINDMFSDNQLEITAHGNDIILIVKIR